MPNKYFLILALIVLNFMLQSFNLLDFRFCNFYEFDPSCSNKIAVVLNKNFRLFIHILVIWLCIQGDNNLKLSINKKILYISIASLLLLEISYFLTFFKEIPLYKIAFHKVINGLIFSPMIGIGLLAKMYFDKQQKLKP